MTKQFKVGQVWADREGGEWKVFEIITESRQYPIIAYKLKSNITTAFTSNGHFYDDGDTDKWDLITLIKDVEDNVSKL